MKRALLTTVMLIGCSQPSEMDMAAKQAAAHPHVDLYVTPKISHDGKSPANADKAKAVGRASAQPKDPQGKLRIEARLPGGKWKTVLTEKMGKDGGVDFDVDQGKEYRARYLRPGQEDVLSTEQRASWLLAFDEGFGQKDVQQLEAEGRWGIRHPAYDPNSESRSHSKGDWRAVDMHDGTVRLWAKRDPDKKNHFLNGHISTEGRWTFTSGWAAARVRFHGRGGSHSCFWLMNGYTPGKAEIDVAEDFGRLQANVYWDWDGDDQGGKEDIKNKRWFMDEHFDGLHAAKRYHVYAVHWQAGKRYEFFVDGQRFAATTKGVATDPEFIILSMLTNDGERAKYDDEHANDYKFEIDWVRVWQDDVPAAGSPPPVSEWNLANELDGNSDATFVYGTPGDVAVVGDWDGNGVTTSGVFDDGTWSVSDVFGGEPEQVLSFGQAGDVPVVGDWDGDGLQTPGVFRAGTWYLSNDLAGTVHHTFAFGSAGDQPVVGDWDGDGIATVGVFRAGQWTLSNTLGAGSDATFQLGAEGDRAVAGDWDGDGRAGPGVFRAGAWVLGNELDGGIDHAFEYGGAGDAPLAGNWDGSAAWGVGLHR